MKKTMFVAGLVSGVVLSRWWRSLAKEGIKLGVHAGQKLSEMSQQVREELESTSSQEQPPGAGE